MAETSAFLLKKRYAVVTGGNKGLGLEICRQLALQGVKVILTSRDEKKGLKAVENLKNSGVNPDNLDFHQLDVTDSATIASLAHFINAKYGKLDILVNNAGVIGLICDFNDLPAVVLGERLAAYHQGPPPPQSPPTIWILGFRLRLQRPSSIFNSKLLEAPTKTKPGARKNFAEKTQQTYELAEECLKTNYYGVKNTIEALLSLLQSSDSPRIINISSRLGKLNNITNERIKGILGDVENLTEKRVEDILNELLNDFKDGSVTKKDWPYFFTAYTISKAAQNAYTRMLAKKYPSMMINCLCPGYVRTDINGNTGNILVEDGGASPVRLALMPHGSPSGLFFLGDEVSCF